MQPQCRTRFCSDWAELQRHLKPAWGVRQLSFLHLALVPLPEVSFLFWLGPGPPGWCGTCVLLCPTVSCLIAGMAPETAAMAACIGIPVLPAGQAEPAPLRWNKCCLTGRVCDRQGLVWVCQSSLCPVRQYLYEQPDLQLGYLKTGRDPALGLTSWSPCLSPFVCSMSPVQRLLI